MKFNNLCLKRDYTFKLENLTAKTEYNTVWKVQGSQSSLQCLLFLPSISANNEINYGTKPTTWWWDATHEEYKP